MAEMVFATFDDFCIRNRIRELKDAFYQHLLLKYNGKIPNEVNLSKEWNEFLVEMTSKL